MSRNWNNMVYSCNRSRRESRVSLSLSKEQCGNCWAVRPADFFRMAYFAITSSPTTHQPTTISKEATETKHTQKPDARR
jgi:hypothetical protein